MPIYIPGHRLRHIEVDHCDFNSLKSQFSLHFLTNYGGLYWVADNVYRCNDWMPAGVDQGVACYAFYKNFHTETGYDNKDNVYLKGVEIIGYIDGHQFVITTMYPCGKLCL